MKPAKKVKFEPVVVLGGTYFKKHVVLRNAKVPSKLSIDRLKNNLFFSMYADEVSDQSFNSVVLNLDTGLNAIIPDISNGFASAVDPAGSVYLGGSNGIFRFNYDSHNVDKPGILQGVDICDMYFHECLYFVETANRNLFKWKEEKKSRVDNLAGYGIQHFLITENDDILFVNCSGVFMLQRETSFPITFGGASRDAHFRGMTVDANGLPYLIAQDGIYTIDVINRHVIKKWPLENGHGLAFDNDNNIIYSDERSVTKLIRLLKMDKTF